ncbi:PAS domain-containing protein [Persephonella atlantica]|uniref:PAS domain-containing protein n=1 Tax=Persephonella atlantica TaxID=2699429 RepID=A0ABS1GGH0_9AQUI|nr:PAS domain-containing protein [Persephonella atlantica]MBK3332024.1 PAS domain-containing protein [Persephonella atlantica]
MDKTFDMFWETEVPENELIISRTDLNGIITYVNETFAKISGYSPEELIGKPHNIIRHPDMPKSVFKELWETIKQGKTWRGYVKNLRKDKGYYWVYAEISGVYKDGQLVEYKSMRAPVSGEKKKQMQDLYDQMREEEGGAVRVVMYLEKEVYDRLEQLSQELGISGEEVIKKLLSEVKT